MKPGDRVQRITALYQLSQLAPSPTNSASAGIWAASSRAMRSGWTGRLAPPAWSMRASLGATAREAQAGSRAAEAMLRQGVRDGLDGQRASRAAIGAATTRLRPISLGFGIDLNERRIGAKNGGAAKPIAPAMRQPTSNTTSASRAAMLPIGQGKTVSMSSGTRPRLGPWSSTGMPKSGQASRWRRRHGSNRPRPRPPSAVASPSAAARPRARHRPAQAPARGPEGSGRARFPPPPRRPRRSPHRGDFQQHRAGLAGQRDARGHVDIFAEPGRIMHHLRPFGDRAHEARVIELLLRASIQHPIGLRPAKISTGEPAS